MRVDLTQRPNKKHRYSLKKHTFCPRARRSAAYRIIVNKIKKKLVSRLKIASPCCGDQDQSCDIQRSHSPVKLKPLGAGGLGEINVSMFFYRLVFCVLCFVCFAHRVVRGERRENSIRPLVSGRRTYKSSRRIWYKKIT